MKKILTSGLIIFCILMLLPVTSSGADFLLSTQIFNQIFDETTDSIKITIASEAITGNYSIGGTMTIGGNIILENAETVTNGTDGQIDLNGDVYLAGAVKFETCTIAADDLTPDIAGCHILTTTANTGATAITDLDNPVVGSLVHIIGGSATNSSTIADSGNFALSAAWTAGLDDVLILFVQADNDYIEFGRVDN